MTDRELRHDVLSKVPAVTLGFWIIKVLAVVIVALIMILRQRPGSHPGKAEARA